MDYIDGRPRPIDLDDVDDDDCELLCCTCYMHSVNLIMWILDMVSYISRMANGVVSYAHSISTVVMYGTCRYC